MATREEVDVLRDMVVAAREENEQLAARIKALEARLDALEGRAARRAVRLRRLGRRTFARRELRLWTGPAAHCGPRPNLRLSRRL